MTIKHRFQSNIPDGTDSSVVRPSNWNDVHVDADGNVIELSGLAERTYYLYPSNPDVLGYIYNNPYVAGTNGEDVLVVSCSTGDPAYIDFNNGPGSLAKKDYTIKAIDCNVYIEIDWNYWSGNLYDFADVGTGLRLNIGKSLTLNYNGIIDYVDNWSTQNQFTISHNNIEWIGGYDLDDGYERRYTLNENQYTNLGGSSGYSGYSGENGLGESGYSGFSGSGISGYSGESVLGESGYSGYSGENGLGESGYSGYSGENGLGESGYSGYSGENGLGESGYSGYSGENGLGESGYSGYSGENGLGESGYSGYSGENGLGESGYSGYSGENGLGESGYSGYSGITGLDGDRYTTTSSTNLEISAGTQTLEVESGLQLSIGQTVIIAFDSNNKMEGTISSYIGTTLIVDVTSTTGSGSHSNWSISLSGAPGPIGDSGYSGYSGATGSSTSGFSGYSGATGSSTSGFSGYSGSGVSGYSGATGVSTSGFSGYSGSGVSGYSGATGSSTSGFSGYSGSGVSGYSGAIGSSTSGFSGYSGSGTSGYSGSGVSGYSGATGVSTSGFSGYSGSGVSGYSGSGTSGYSGATGSSTSGFSGYSGSGTSGYSGATGSSTSGFSGYSGSGVSGYSGSGVSGYSGSGISGYSGHSGYNQDTLIFPVDINRFGFINRTETTLSFDGTDVISLSGSSWSYYRSGLKYTITGNKTLTVATPMVDGTMYYIYIDGTTGTLISGSAWTFNDTKVPVATLFWNSTLTPKYILADERHTCKIDREFHREHHYSEGTRAISLGTISGLTPASTVDTNKTFGITGTQIYDEDLFYNLSAIVDPDGATPTYYNLYRNGTTTSYAWAIGNMPFKYTGTVAPFGWIEYDNGSGVSTQAIANRYVNTYIIASNSVANNEANPEINTTGTRYFILQGRGIFTSAALAAGESFSSFNLVGAPFIEAVAIYQMTWYTGGGGGYANTVKGRCSYVSTQQISGNVISTSAVSTTAHNTLTGIQGGQLNDYYHITSTQHSQLAPELSGGTSGYVLSNDGTITEWIAYTLDRLNDTAINSVQNNDVLTWNSASGAWINSPTQATVLPKAQTLTVAISGGDYTSVAGAMSAIGDASITKPYVIRVAPGVYTESPFGMKPFVSIKGDGGYYSVTIQTNDNSSHFITGANASEIIDCLLIGPSGTGYSTVYQDGVTGSGSVSASLPMKLNGCTFGGGYYCAYAYSIGATRARLHLIHCGNIGVSPYPVTNTGVYGYGKTNIVILDSAIMSGSTGAVGTGFKAESSDGTHIAEMTIDNCSFKMAGGVGLNSVGADVRCKSVTFNSCTTGILISGTASLSSTVHVAGAELTSGVTNHFIISDVYSELVFSGTADKNKITNNGTLTAVFSDETIGEEGQVVMGELWLGTQGTSIPLRDYGIKTYSTGWISGGDFARVGDPGLVYDISGGEGYINNGTTVKKVIWTTQQLTATQNILKYIYVDINGTVFQSTVHNLQDYILLGIVEASSTDITFLTKFVVPISQHLPRMTEYLSEVIGPISVDGGQVVANGDNALQVNVSGGEFYRSFKEIIFPDATAPSFHVQYLSGGEWIHDDTGTGIVDTAYYCPSSASDGLHLIPTDKYTKHVLFVYPSYTADTFHYHFVYGDTFYDTAQDAYDSANPAYPDTDRLYALRLAGFIVKQGATSIERIKDLRPKIGQSASQGDRGPTGATGASGYSGYSGSGTSGYSGYSGATGVGISGYSGYSGDSTSGFSGYSGSGVSGYSGATGSSTSGFSGYSGSGVSGYSGATGSSTSGFSGYSGSGVSGYSGATGSSTSGFSGYSGSGVSGYSGATGSSTSGFSGYSGSGVSGYSGATGSSTSGFSGYSGSGVSGYSGATGSSTSGFSGYSGSGVSGYSGATGSSTSGFSGYSGSGVSGYSGYSGSGVSGYSGLSGTQYTWKGTWDSGTAYVINDCIDLNGTGYVCVLGHTNQTPPNLTYWNVLVASGYSGYSGSGTSGYSGATGSGVSGYSGAAGASTSGFSGYSGSGVSGYSGSGVSGYSGATGAGTSGFSGYSGENGLGESGYSGYSGATGAAGDLITVSYYIYSGTTTLRHNKQASCNKMLVRMLGGGGGGGGANSAANNASAGAGGGAGGYLEVWIPSSVNASYNYYVGNGGAGGAAAGGTAGVAGQATQFGNENASWNYWANGGVGGTLGGNNNATPKVGAGGAGGATSGNASHAVVQVTGATGGASIIMNKLWCQGGVGAASTMGGPGGAGGVSINVVAMAGQAATAKGSGGGGGAVGNGANSTTGGAGAAGLIIVYEYT